MENVTVQRAFGRVKSEEKLGEFIEWFTDNISKLEETMDEVNPKNGQLTLDWQGISNSFIVEVQTTNEDFSKEICGKYKELGFADFNNIGVVTQIS